MCDNHAAERLMKYDICHSFLIIDRYEHIGKYLLKPFENYENQICFVNVIGLASSP